MYTTTNRRIFMGVINNTTIDSEINGAGIDIDANIFLVTDIVGEEFVSPYTARFRRRLHGGIWSYIGPTYNLSPNVDGDRINQVISHRDTSVSDQNTYEYSLEMEVYTEVGTPE